MSNLIIFIIAGCCSVVMAILLARLAGLSFQTKINLESKRVAPKVEGGSLKSAVFKEVSSLLDSPEKTDEIAKALEGLVSEEMEKRAVIVDKELTKKYETVIKQKTKNEEFAWSKYNKTLSEKKSTDAVIHSIAQGLVVVDSNGKVIMMNPAAEKLLETNKKDKIGKSIVDDTRDEQMISLNKDFSGEEKEIELISQADDTTKTLRSSSAVIENENGQTIGMVSVLSDVTKQKQLNRMKNDFVANVTHELRTPLITIDKSISLLRSQAAGPVSETQEQFLTIAERNIKRLGSLINDLLDLSKLEAGKMEMKFEKSSVDFVVSDVAQTFTAWAEAKSITIEKNIEDNIPEIDIDPNRIIQVITNLAGNALKFTPKEGKIIFGAKYLKDSREVVFSVADTGIGIPEDDISKIFDKFYQTGERAPTDISGTGLGLSICREMVDAHKGRIWAESKKGEGAKFLFALPQDNKMMEVDNG